VFRPGQLVAWEGRDKCLGQDIEWPGVGKERRLSRLGQAVAWVRRDMCLGQDWKGRDRQWPG